MQVFFMPGVSQLQATFYHVQYHMESMFASEILCQLYHLYNYCTWVSLVSVKEKMGYLISMRTGSGHHRCLLVGIILALIEDIYNMHVCWPHLQIPLWLTSK